MIKSNFQPMDDDSIYHVNCPKYTIVISTTYISTVHPVCGFATMGTPTNTDFFAKRVPTFIGNKITLESNSNQTLGKNPDTRSLENHLSTSPINPSFSPSTLLLWYCLLFDLSYSVSKVHPLEWFSPPFFLSIIVLYSIPYLDPPLLNY